MAFSILIWFLIAIALLGTFYGVLGIIVNNIYDVRAIKRLRYLKQHPYAKENQYRPLVTVLIPAFEEEQLIERCVTSVLKSRYRKYQIVVIDDHSGDSTAKIVRKLADKFPHKDLQVVRKRKNQGKGAALKTGMRYAKGEIILTIDADCTVDKFALQRAVKYFADPMVKVVTGNVRIHPSANILGLLQQFEFLIGFRTKKFHSVANSEYIAGGASSFYRKSVIGKAGGFRTDMKAEDIALSLAIAALGNKEHRMAYATDVIMYTEPVPTYKGLLSQRFRWKIGSLQAITMHRKLLFSGSRKYTKMLSWLRLPLAVYGEIMLILEPIAFAWFIYMAIYQQSTMLYIGASVTLTSLALIHIWGDEYHNLRDKIELSILAPALYPLFFIMTSIQLVSITRVFMNYKVVLGKRKVEGNWHSPGRLAELQS